MELHPKLKELLAAPADPNATPVEQQSPEEARAEFERDFAAVDGEKPDIHSTEEIQIPGPGGPLRLRIYEPGPREGGSGRPALVYCHGGGYIRGSVESHDSACRLIANSSGCVTASVDYRLSPESKFPDAIEDCYAATKWFAENAAAHGADGSRLAVGGDSAGGNMAAAVTLMARDRSGPKIAFQLLIYPNTDLAADNESMRLFSKGYWLDSMPFYIRSYLGSDADRANELASPLRASDLSGLPPAYVVTAGFDPLRDEGKAYAERLAQDGGAVESVCYANMIHGFTALRAILPEADEALKACGDAVRRSFAGD
ncbi:MAG: alpha/beta hydrolase [Alphaproteobacteria bacterium]